MIGLPPGVDPLRHAALNKGTAFTVAERDALGLHGLLPPRVCTMEEQIVRVMENLRRKESPLEKYIFLTALQGVTADVESARHYWQQYLAQHQAREVGRVGYSILVYRIP